MKLKKYRHFFFLFVVLFLFVFCTSLFRWLEINKILLRNLLKIHFFDNLATTDRDVDEHISTHIIENERKKKHKNL